MKKNRKDNIPKIEGEYLSIEELQINGTPHLRVYYLNEDGGTRWTQFEKDNTYFESMASKSALQNEFKKVNPDKETINTFKILSQCDKILADYLRKEDLSKYFTSKSTHKPLKDTIDNIPKHHIIKMGVDKLLSDMRIEEPSTTLEKAKRLYGNQTGDTYENVNKLYHYKPKK
jgi:hypothetical protein